VVGSLRRQNAALPVFLMVDPEIWTIC
jgi:hypothetical protein